MSYGESVHTRRRRRKGWVAFPPSHQASVRIVVGDAFGTFVREAAMSRPWRIAVISPWIGGEQLERDALERLIMQVDRRSAAMIVVTRPPQSAAHTSAIDAISRLPRAKIILNPRVHAKLYIGEERHGRGFAVVGSGNATASSATLDEAAVLIRPVRGSAIIRHLASTTVGQLSGGSTSQIWPTIDSGGSE